ncbi:unnamed protein product [Symbiodinium sp. CCMP2592]|nr:unnamed protein product [Symbiodinium sp. CCMP2592]
MSGAQLGYRFTFIDVTEDGKTDGDDHRARARSLPPIRASVANSETLVVDAWAHLHLRTLRQGRDATVFEPPAPNRGSVGHPTLCSRPCIYVAKQGQCQKGVACGFCHHDHHSGPNDPKPDKQQRRLMSTMPRAELLGLLAELLQDRAEQDGFHDVGFVVAAPWSIRWRLPWLDMVGGLLDGAQLACGATEAVAVQAGLRPSRPQTKSRKLANLRQVPQTLGRVRVVLLGLLNVSGDWGGLFKAGFKRQVIGRMNFSAILSIALRHCEGHSKASILQELKALRNNVPDDNCRHAMVKRKRGRAAGGTALADFYSNSMKASKPFAGAMSGAQLGYRFTFIDVTEDSKTDGDDHRARARSLPPIRASVANSETLVVDAWAHLHLRTLRQGRDATVFEPPAPNRGSVGHPALCSRPCIYVAKQRQCQKGVACGFCHHDHHSGPNDPKPDKQQRRLMSTMPRAELLGLLAELLQDRAEQDGFHDVGFVVAAPWSIRWRLRWTPSKPPADEVSKACQLAPGDWGGLFKAGFKRQVIGRMNFSAILSIALRHCEGHSKASILQELKALRDNVPDDNCRHAMVKRKRGRAAGGTALADFYSNSMKASKPFAGAMSGAQLGYRFTFIDVTEDSKTDGDDHRARARSLPPIRASVANSETLVVDAWAHLHLRTLRQGRDATVVEPPAPNRGSVGHPTLCSRPCIYVAKQGQCQKGVACGFCHHDHHSGPNDPKPDKQQRRLMSTMPRAELLGLLAELLQDRAEQDGFHDVGFVVAAPWSIRWRLPWLDMVGGLLDGAQLACGATEAVAVQAGLRPSRPQTKSRKLANLRQVPQTLGDWGGLFKAGFKRQVIGRMNFSAILSIALRHCEGHSKASILQELKAQRNNVFEAGDFDSALGAWRRVRAAQQRPEESCMGRPGHTHARGKTVGKLSPPGYGAKDVAYCVNPGRAMSLLGLASTAYRFGSAALMCSILGVICRSNQCSMEAFSRSEASVWLAEAAVGQGTSAPKRRLRWTWELIDHNGVLCGTNTQRPNLVVGELLRQRLLPGVIFSRTACSEILPVCSEGSSLLGEAT